MAARFWTTTEEALLRAAYPTQTPVSDIAAQLGRSQQSVRHHAKRLGLSRIDQQAISVRDRLMALVRVDEETGCWIWQGGVNRKGHPRLHLQRIGQLHPRVELLRLDGLWRDTTHCTRTTCGDELCVSPQHARQLTAKKYLRERFAEGTLGHASHRAGIAASQRKRASRVTLELVREVRQRRAAGATLDELMTVWPQSRVSLTAALRGERWAEATTGASAFSWRPAGEGVHAVDTSNAGDEAADKDKPRQRLTRFSELPAPVSLDWKAPALNAPVLPDERMSA